MRVNNVQTAFVKPAGVKPVSRQPLFKSAEGAKKQESAPAPKQPSLLSRALGTLGGVGAGGAASGAFFEYPDLVPDNAMLATPLVLVSVVGAFLLGRFVSKAAAEKLGK